ncbi:MAG TPA: hypothetical protein PKZ97_03020 [Azospirillaceae bacterium]|nr:hypothetical protein [Azospirillaceae bacterium]
MTIPIGGKSGFAAARRNVHFLFYSTAAESRAKKAVRLAFALENGAFQDDCRIGAGGGI